MGDSHEVRIGTSTARVGADESHFSITHAILMDPNAFVAALALIFSILITYVNYQIFIVNRDEERIYKRDFTLYKLLVLPACKHFLDFATLAHDQINILHKKCMQNAAAGQPSRSVVEESVEQLDRANAFLEREVLIVMAGFSSQLRRDASKVVEDYYDRMTTIFAEFDRSSISADFAGKQHSLSKKHSQKFIDDVFACIRDSCPPQQKQRGKNFLARLKKRLPWN